jgi:hypothetical protein
MPNRSLNVTDSEGCLGYWRRDDAAHRLSLHETDQPGVAHLRRHRVAADPPYDVAAEVVHEGGTVTSIAWDDWHRAQASQTWRAGAELWIKACIKLNWEEAP